MQRAVGKDKDRDLKMGMQCAAVWQWAAELQETAMQ
ncbi:hypothetical protein PF005_g29472 [Phytophthora fragariae]|uniref:Uncharacterized protein n=1 Tax=Phytophthora fragariae TaxID=53985 RepID=A0A6A3DER7_9STRA|nr:hypothetical protein PF009_g29848 [Phytophthora fragariae]KAE9063560.1 hypothetical protein PF010_g28946 [Phytophthora fragariae]KAE9064467.1 hypothetical protein PF007_g29190 [Phytophthora fragariae]KAE9165752.1 hypothetical protein PF005_g29472 [Phytophthora fragariae]KAE9168732.1 hypothetical protein PF004_g28414 [Phytophthora fragariae]